MEANQNAEMPKMLSAKDISQHLGVSLSSAYALFKQSDFPAITIGKRKLISREGYEKWLETTKGGKNNV